MNEENFKLEMKEAGTVTEVFNVLQKYYKLESVKLGILSKNILLNNLDYFINYLKVPKREE